MPNCAFRLRVRQLMQDNDGHRHKPVQPKLVVHMNVWCIRQNYIGLSIVKIMR